MSITQAITTFVGSFAFAFMIRVLWNTFVNENKILGGLLASIFIVGIMWVINHGIPTPLIYQTGAWVDMGLAAFGGGWIATLVLGKSLKNSLPTLSSAIIAGILSGVVIGMALTFN